MASHYHSYGGRIVYGFNRPKALKALAGHPRIYLAENAEISAELIARSPELRVEENADGLRLCFTPPVDGEHEVVMLRETPTRFVLLTLDEEQRKLAGLVGIKGLQVPASARERVLQAVGAVAGVITVHSDIGGGTAAREVPAQLLLYAHILPCGEGLRIDLLIKPLGPEGPAHMPGDGGINLVAEVGGERLQTRRGLPAEQELANKLVASCAALTRGEAGRWQWTLDDPEDALEALAALKATEDLVRLEWPHGGKIEVSRLFTASDLWLRVERRGDWLAVGGEVRIDEQQVLSLTKLLGLLQQASGRFVPLGDGQYLAITEALRKRLEALRVAGESARTRYCSPAAGRTG